MSWCVGRRAHMEFDFRMERAPPPHNKNTEAGPLAFSSPRGTGHANTTRPQPTVSRDRTTVLPGCVGTYVLLSPSLLHRHLDNQRRPVHIFSPFYSHGIVSCGQSGFVRFEERRKKKKGPSQRLTRHFLTIFSWRRPLHHLEPFWVPTGESFSSFLCAQTKILSDFRHRLMLLVAKRRHATVDTLPPVTHPTQNLLSNSDDDDDESKPPAKAQ